jgi:D-amino peptidase
MHAGAGNRSGVLAHTYTSLDIEYRVNGVPFNESMILAMGSARLKIPVVMVSGDDQLEKEIRRNMPWARYATVKTARGVGRAEPLPRAEASRRIEAAAREAIAGLGSMRLMEFAGPYRFALKFEEPGQAENAALFAGAERLSDGLTVQVRAHDFEDGYRQSLRLIGLGGIVRSAAGAQAAIGRLPNAAEVRAGITDWSYDRWINGVAPAQPGAPPARYWGAR